jgi:hypothetical protein
MSDSEQMVGAVAPEEAAPDSATVEVISVDALLEENARLKTEVKNLTTEGLIWRELIAEMREMVVQHFQGFPHSRPYDRIRKLLANPGALAAEVAKRVAAREKPAQ